MADYGPCDVCGATAVGICSSVWGAVSQAYCAECLALGRENWVILTAGCWGLMPDEISDPGFVRRVQPTLDFYHKTVQDIQNEVEAMDREYARYVDEQEAPVDEAKVMDSEGVQWAN